MSKPFYTPDEILTLTRGLRMSTQGTVRRMHQSLTGACADSREVKPGFLFFALDGERTRGCRYIREAFRRGAGAVVASRKTLDREHWYRELNREQRSRVILVEDALGALQLLGKHWVSRFPSMKRIAVTGSCGKTTTKELIASILSEAGATVKNPGNRNSTIGLPLSLFSVNDEHEFGVFEMGINHIGEMDQLVDIYAPEISLITNIGTAHIGNFGSSERIAYEKSKVLTGSARLGYIYENSRWKSYIGTIRGIPLQDYGETKTPGIERYHSRGLSGWAVSYRGEQVHLPLVGYHNLVNAYGAIALAEDLGVPRDSVKRGIENVKALFGRGRVIEGPVTIIEDCYNANAESMHSMLRYLSSLKWSRGQVALILGSMKELGERTLAMHRLLGRWIAKLNPAGVFLLGSEMEAAYREVKNRCSTSTLVLSEDCDELQIQIRAFVKRGDLALVKGSRTMEMERLTAALQQVG